VNELARLATRRELMKGSGLAAVKAIVEGRQLEEDVCQAYAGVLLQAAGQRSEAMFPDLPAFERLYQRVCTNPEK